MRSRRLKKRSLSNDLHEDPFALLVNFFDCSLVFALGFILALLAKPETVASLADGARRPPTPETVAGDPRREPLSVSKETGSGEGVRLGTAYRLANGDIVYVPDGTSPPR